MRNENPEFRIFRKEWRARARLLAVVGGVMLLMLAYMMGSPKLNGRPLVLFAAFAFAALGVRLFPDDEADPARSFVYQLPISRGRLLGIKLAALAAQVGALLVVFVVGSCFLLERESYPQYGSRWSGNFTTDFVELALAVFSALALALLAAIVSLHMRSAIVAIVVTLALALVLGWLILLPHLIGNQSDAQIIANLGWIVAKFLIATAVLAGWLFFLFCRTPIQEVRPSPRGLLVFVFAAGAVEFFYTLFYTGWRDLAYLIFGF